jgi:hypothetical protein
MGGMGGMGGHATRILVPNSSSSFISVSSTSIDEDYFSMGMNSVTTI